MAPPPRAAALLDAWLAARLTADAAGWLRGAVAATEARGAAREFLLTYSLATRRIGRAPLAPTAAELDEAQRVRPGLQPERWTLDEAARVRLLLALPATDARSLSAALDRLAADADLGERVALARALPLLPFPEAHAARIAEGIRSNLLPVVDATALDDPLPAEVLGEAAWNQLVMKCLFVGLPLRRVHGLDARANAALARSLAEFARERRAASRPVPAELFRVVARFPAEEAAALADAVERGDLRELAAVALGLPEGPLRSALLGPRAERVRLATREYPDWAAVAGA